MEISSSTNCSRKKDEAPKQLFASKKLKYPPEKILLRAFKKESALELWVQDSPGSAYALVKSYSTREVWNSRAETAFRRRASPRRIL
jgi:murein L,D-transpeptidase YafK